MERHEKIAANLDRLIKEAGTTQSALAKSVGLNHTAARDIISGKSRNPTSRTLYMLARGLKVHISAITGEAPPDFDAHEPISMNPGEVEETSFGAQTADTLKYLAPNTESPILFLVTCDAPGFGVSVGDLLVVDCDKPPQVTGANVIVARPPGRFQSMRSCGIGKYFPPYIIPADPALFGVAFDYSGDGPSYVVGSVVASFRLDPGTTAALLNGSQDLE